MIATGAAALIAFPGTGEVRAADAPHVVAADQIAAGRFLVDYGDCNDCHTARFSQVHDAIPESRRLTGNPRGFKGPWGTSYAPNLRLVFASMTEQQWLRLVRDPRGVDHRPMPWWNVQQLTTGDQRAIYAYIRSLGPAGKVMPAYEPPVSH
jgi:mono/diheme cytochrome c family protein